MRPITSRFKFRLPLFFQIIIPAVIFTGLAWGQAKEPSGTYGLVIHGGAGTISRENMTSEREKQYTAKLTEALETGYQILASGGSSLDAIEATIVVLEDSPLFNAGKGAVYTSAGTHELDASIMDGRTQNSGAVAGVKSIKNPIRLARRVMEHSPHVMLSGEGAVTFAREQGLETVGQDYFHVERRWRQLQKVNPDFQGVEPSHGKGSIPENPSTKPPDKHGTVGAVALDQSGNLAAATSTGGMTNKRFGRIGDSPIIGAGTYANNRTCAVSATGHGEYFIRSVVAHDISALMEYGNRSLKDAAETVIMEKLVDMGGSGGIIAIDKDGNMAMPFNTTGMYRGYVGADGKITVRIYGD